MNKAAVPNVLFTPTWTPYQPNVRVKKAPLIPDEVWDRHRYEIVQKYVQLDWKLEDVRRHMKEAHNFSATKRQYTWKLEKWGCHKYKSPSQGSTPSQPTPTTQGSLSPHPNNTLRTDPMDVDGIAWIPAASSSYNQLRSSTGAGMVSIPAVASDVATVNAKALTAQDYLAAIGGHSPWTGGSATPFRGFNLDVDMDEMLDTIPEERPASSLSKVERSSTEDASSRDFSSVSSVNRSVAPIGSPSHSPGRLVPSSLASDAAPGADISVVQRYSPTEHYVLSPFRGEKTASIEQEQGMPAPAVPTDRAVEAANPIDDGSYRRPVLTHVPELTQKVSPMALLKLVAIKNVSGELSEGDLCRIERLAEVFEAARSYEDAYQLRRLVLQQAIDRHSRDKTSPRSPQTRVVNLVKDANNPNAYKEAIAFVRSAWNENPTLLEQDSIVGCVQRSYHGSIQGARTDTRSAEHYCRRSARLMSAIFDSHRVLDGSGDVLTVAGRESSYFVASWLHVISNLVSVLQEIHTLGGAWALVEGIWPDGLILPSYKDEVSRLNQIYWWCADALAKEDFREMLSHISSDLWLLAPSKTELEDAESAVLSFYLWTQTQAKQVSNQNSTTPGARLRPQGCNCITDFADDWGIPTAEVLSVIASILLARQHGFDETPSKSNLPQRAGSAAYRSFGVTMLSSVQNQSDNSFMKAHAAILHKKGNRFTTEAYGTLVRSVVRDMIERSFDLELEVSALHDPSPRVRASLLSMAPSNSPTMLSTPRSSGSWRSWRSIQSTKRRAGKLVANIGNGDDDFRSFLLSRRWSGTGSIKSATTLQSSAPSSGDVIMGDDIES